MIKAVIFDLDGVICSTDEYHYRAWKQLADSIGIDFNREINERLRGVSRMTSLDIVLENSSVRYSDEEKAAMAELKNAVYCKLLSEMSPADLDPGVEQLLLELKKDGVKLAIGSSSKNAKTILAQLGITELFDAISDGTNITRSKPDPEVFLNAAEMLGISPEECLVVEDAIAGIEAAASGGFICAGIGTAAYHPRCDYKLSVLPELQNVFAGY